MRPTHSTQDTKIKRPLSIKLLGLCLALSGVYGILRGWSAITYWPYLSEVLAPFQPYYLVVTGALQAIGSGILVYVLWRGRRRAPNILMTGCGALAVFAWIERIGLASDPAALQRIPFMIGSTILFLAFVAWTLYHPAGSAYFKARNSMSEERKENDET